MTESISRSIDERVLPPKPSDRRIGQLDVNGEYGHTGEDFTGFGISIVVLKGRREVRCLIRHH